MSDRQQRGASVATSYHHHHHHGPQYAGRRRVRIRPRPVSFGNPALGTYKGCVYTAVEQPQSSSLDEQQQRQLQPPHSSSSSSSSSLLLLSSSSSNNNNAFGFLSHEKPLIEGAVIAERLVAMVNVPPEQVPEGVLNLTRAHQPYLTHVRIVIEEGDVSNDIQEEDVDEEEENYHDEVDDECGEKDEQYEDSGVDNDQAVDLTMMAPELSQRSRSYPPYSYRPNSASDSASTLLTRDPPFVTAMENAASILAADESMCSTERTATSSPINKIPTTTTVQQDKEERMLFATPRHHFQDQQQQQQQQHTRPNRSYLILFELVSEDAANTFVEDLHGKPYTSLDETDTCSVHHVVALKGDDGVSLMSPFFAPSTKKSSDGLEIVPSSSSVDAEDHLSHDNNTNTTTTTTTTSNAELGPVLSKASSASAANSTTSTAEVQNCAVCLDRMDFDSSRPDTCVLTTVCNHTFHLDCLVKWQDSPCPVCRYDHSGLNEALSECHVCGSTEHNYVCLICGVVSCGGATAAITASASRMMMMLTTPPSATRSTTTLHRSPYGEASMKSINNNNNTDSSNTSANGTPVLTTALTSDVRLSSSHARKHYDETLHAYALDTETQHVFDFAGQGYVHRLLQNKDDGKLVEVNDPNNTTSQERSLSPGLSDAQEGEVVHRKLEGFASQYYTLLKSQLEQQRIYYEGRLQEIRLEYGRYRRGSNAHEARSKKSGSTADLIAALKQERNQLTQRLLSLQGRHDKVREDVVWLMSMNESLDANKDALKRQIEEAQRQRAEARNMIQQCLPLLEEKLALLMLQLEETSNFEMPLNPQQSGDRKPAAR